MSANAWTRFKEQYWSDPTLGMGLDVSRMGLDPAFWTEHGPRFRAALTAMAELEGGAMANPDEGRMVGHYWLRAPDLAPDPDIREDIDETLRRIRAFAATVHAGRIRPLNADRFTHLLVIGIGGSALGPQFVADALRGYHDPLTPHFIDNTDPDGIDVVLNSLEGELRRTLVLIISKSGGTKETRNGMFEVESRFEELALDFSRHAVAVTGEDSQLHDYAREMEFLDVFPMWDWVGGRTSVFSPVGLLPAALQGVDVEAFLAGARAMDAVTRRAEPRSNPAALLAAAWFKAGNGRGDRNMVVLPYKDRLLLFSRYLQQLVMESLGKELNLEGNTVHQGLSVFGNKGSTDQHAFVQQLRDGRDDFFMSFIQVLRDRDGESIRVDEDVTSGDYLLGFLLGTRRALSDKGRSSLTLTLPDVSPRSVGALIALYERAVGLYANLLGINAYHQPGVEAGKKAAGDVLSLQRAMLEAMQAEPRREWTAESLAAAAGSDDPETALAVLDHLAANPDHAVRRKAGEKPWEASYWMESEEEGDDA